MKINKVLLADGYRLIHKENNTYDFVVTVTYERKITERDKRLLVSAFTKAFMEINGHTKTNKLER